MQNGIILDEQAMLAAEASIPKLATQAVKLAYARALSTSGTVLEAINGKLVETDRDGRQRIVRALQLPTPIAIGTKRHLRRASVISTRS